MVKVVFVLKVVFDVSIVFGGKTLKSEDDKRTKMASSARK